MNPRFRLFAAAAALSLASGPAFAYIGPGAGLGAVAAFWSLLVAVLSAIGFLVLWPLRHRLGRRSAGNPTAREDMPTALRDEPPMRSTDKEADTDRH